MIRVRNIPVGLRFDLTIKQDSKMYHVVTNLCGRPFYPIQYQRTSSDFGNRFGYYRGHICASADRLYSREVNEQTFIIQI